jgi:acyl-CoA thioesterase YciA
VTVAMDRIVFHDPVFLGDIVSFFTETSRVGRTSVTVEVCVWAHRAREGGEPVQVTEAQVTLVAVDEDFRPTPLNQD